jgi:GTP cyclohydrolase II
MTSRTPAENSVDGHEAVGAAARRSVARAVCELRRGWPVAIDGGPQAAVLLSPETMGEDAFALVAALSPDGLPTLLLTARRARALGLTAAEGRPVALRLGRGADVKALRALADPTAGPAAVRPLPVPSRVSVGGLEEAALALVRRAGLLPAALLAPLCVGSGQGGRAAMLAERAAELDLLVVRSEDTLEICRGGESALWVAAEARVPLRQAQARVLAFRPSDGGPDHFAVIVGAPRPDRPPLVRVHSECLTGDVLGSLRCDCGEQLDGALLRMAGEGAGVLVYLAQEGRGIGLVNKLRSYQIQDQGLDTLEANEWLGFEADERAFWPAAAILRCLGVTTVRLLTNNPAKVAALSRLSITVVERVPHAFPSNGHNDAYLRTKAKRAGHLL